MMPTRASLVILLALVSWSLTATASRATPEIFQRTVRSTVLIIANGDKEKGSKSIGSGALLDVKRRLVITNCHVVGTQKEVGVFFPIYEKGQLVADPQQYIKNISNLVIPGKVLATDRGHDLALLELRSVPEGVPALTLARASVRIGEAIYSVGNSGLSEGVLWRYTHGDVRQIGQRKLPFGKGKDRNIFEGICVESQSPVNPGDSGGPVVNDRCELVAVTMGLATNLQLVSWSIDVSEVRAFVGKTVPLKDLPETTVRRDPDRKTPANSTPIKKDPVPNSTPPKKEPEAQPAKPYVIVGSWNVVKSTTGPNAAGSTKGRMRFEDNGSFSMSKSDPKPTLLKGRYTYTGKLLTVSFDEQSKEDLRLTWANKDRFTFVMLNIAYVADRDGTK